MKLQKSMLINISTFLYLFIMIFCFSYRDRTDISSKILFFWPGFILLLFGLYCIIILLLYKLSNSYIIKININIPLILLSLYFYFYFNSLSCYNEIIINIFVMNILLFISILMYLLVSSYLIFEMSLRFAKLLVYLAVGFSIIAILINYNLINIEIGDFNLRPTLTHFPRLSGISDDPTSLGALTGSGALCLLFLIILNDYWIIKLKYIIIILFLLTVLIMTGSRMAIIAFTISGSIMIYLFFGIRKMLKIICYASIFLFFIIILLQYITDDDLMIYFIKLFRPYDISEEGTRLYIWQNTLKIFSEGSILDIIVGRGSLWLRSNYRSAHNAYFEFLVDNGITFLILLLIYSYILYKKIKFAIRNNIDAATAILLGSLLTYVLVFSFYLSSLITKNFFIINFIFICTSLLISRLNISKYFPPKKACFKVK